VKKTAFSDKLELSFTVFPDDKIPKENAIHFPSGGFSVVIYNSALFESLIPGRQYDIELSIVVEN